MRASSFLALAFLLFTSPITWGAKVEDSTFDSDGVKIRYTIDGEGLPVVLVHGYMASGDANWRVTGMTKLLAQNYRVITIDNRGHGYSDKPETPEEYGHHMADDVIHLLDHLKIKKAYFVGYSMGGMIVLNLAVHHPERMEFALITGMGWLPKGPIAPARPAAAALRGRSAAMRSCMAAFPDLGTTEAELKAVKVPMAIIVGEEDHLLESRVKPFESIRPDVSVTLIPGANHISCTYSGEFKEKVKETLDKITAGKR
jgi:pimeloyl-ACP methyl ester carboxylesterase